MGTIARLKQEHELIEAVCARLWQLGHELGTQGSERSQLGELCEFLGAFADHWHARGEEEGLFAALEEHGFPSGDGPVGLMRQEHDMLRAYLAALLTAHRQVSPWTEATRDSVRSAIKAYVDLSRTHRRREDEVLFPLAERQLPAAAQAELDAYDASLVEAHAAEHRRLLALGHALAG